MTNIGFYDEHPVTRVGIRNTINKHFQNICIHELTMGEFVDLSFDPTFFSVLIFGISELPYEIAILKNIKKFWPEIKIVILHSRDEGYFDLSYADIYIAKSNELNVVVNELRKVLMEHAILS